MSPRVLEDITKGIYIYFGVEAWNESQPALLWLEYVLLNTLIIFTGTVHAIWRCFKCLNSPFDNLFYSNILHNTLFRNTLKIKRFNLLM